MMALTWQQEQQLQDTFEDNLQIIPRPNIKSFPLKKPRKL